MARSPFWLAALVLTILSPAWQGCQSRADEPIRAVSEGSGPATVQLGAIGDQFEFDRTAIATVPGQELEVELTNPSDRKSVKHNYVQLDTNNRQTALKVAKAGWKAAEEDYVPQHGSVIAGSPVAGPGETVEVSFAAPDSPGKYLYICTYPGHYPSMRGTLVVREE